MIGVYRIYGKNGKSYIGSSVSIQNRITCHFYLLSKGKSHSPKLQKAYNKYGKKHFTVEILEICCKDELQIVERDYIIKFDSVSNGYNCSYDTNCSTRGRKLSPKQIKDMSIRVKNRWANDDGKMASVSTENAKKATQKRRGSKNTQEHNKAISNANKNKKLSDEHRIKISESRKKNPIRYWLGKKRSPEDIEKFRISHLGIVTSNKPIIQFNLSGEEIARFDGAADASRKIGISRTAIKNNLRKLSKKCHKIYIFKYVSSM